VIPQKKFEDAFQGRLIKKYVPATLGICKTIWYKYSHVASSFFIKMTIKLSWPYIHAPRVDFRGGGGNLKKIVGGRLVSLLTFTMHVNNG
jgi:hypothetical protein